MVGTTLIELMVALTISMVLALTVMMVERNLTQQKSRSNDNTLRDGEIRAATDIIAHDLTSAWFIPSGSNNACDALFTYNAGVAGNYYTHYPVTAVTAVNGNTMPFSPAVTLNYPSGVAVGIPSSVLIITTTAAGTTSAGPSGNAMYTPAANPITTSSLAWRVQPQYAATPPVAGDVGIIDVPLAVPPSGVNACIRFPMKTVATAANITTTTSSGTTFPANFAAFNPYITAADMGTGLSQQAVASGSVVDLGPLYAGAPATPAPQTIAYYIDGSNAWPTLMRATFSLLDDTLIGPPQTIAAGVASLQVVFGVDTLNNGNITAYETWPTLLAAHQEHLVRTALVVTVTRSLYADPNPNFTNTTNKITLSTPTLPLTDITIPGAYMNYRWAVQETEIAIRNCRWVSC